MNSIVIIGASSGIGRRIAEIYIHRGWKVGVAARRTEPLEQLRQLAPQRVVAAAIDITADNAPRQLEAFIADLGGADIIFNVAGVGFANPQLEPAKETGIADTNCLGFTRMIDTAFNYFANTQRRGRIAAVSSIAATNGLGFAPAYSASKSYQATYLTALAQLARMRKLPISITDIRPGFIDTDLLDHTRRYPMLMNPDKAARKIVHAIDRGRRVAVIDWRWNLVVGLWRLIPNCLWTRLPIRLS